MFKQYWNRIEKLWSFRSTSAYLAHLRKTGMRIGEGTEVFARTTDILIDTTRPWLIEIGRNVQLTAGVKILTHGYDWAVLKAKYGDIYGSGQCGGRRHIPVRLCDRRQSGKGYLHIRGVPR